jgi:sugar-specific transcriptional regulator TrmB
MQNISALFNKLGLNEKASKTYLALLELGTATVQEVAEHAGIKRTSVYNFLEELKKFGLVTEILEKNRVILAAEDPGVLKKLAKDKQTEAKQYEESVSLALPELLGLFNLPGGKPKVRFYKGTEGIKRVYEDTIVMGETIYAFSDYEKMMEAMTFDYMVDYANRRTEAGIKFHSIGPGGKWAEKAKKLAKTQKREVKTMNIKFDTEINIYGNKVALISFHRPYTGVIIEDRAIASTLRAIWQKMAGL